MKNKLIISVLLFMTACTSSKNFVKPGVSLVDFKMGDVKILESSWVITIRIENENPFPIKIDGAVYSFYIGGKRIGKGMSDSVLEIPRLGSVTDRVVVRSSNISLALKLKSIVEKKKFDYRLKGKIFLDASGHTRTYYFTRKGHFDFEELQRGINKKDINGGEEL